MVEQTTLSNLGEAMGMATAANAAATTVPAKPKIDAKGRAYATGRRKNAIARVWIKRGSGKVTVNGKVLTSDGRGLRNAAVSITDSQGSVRTTTTSSFGLFSFENVLTGGTYTVRVLSRLFRYTPQTIQVVDNLSLPDFVGLE